MEMINVRKDLTDEHISTEDVNMEKAHDKVYTPKECKNIVADMFEHNSIYISSICILAERLMVFSENGTEFHPKLFPELYKGKYFRINERLHGDNGRYLYYSIFSSTKDFTLGNIEIDGDITATEINSIYKIPMLFNKVFETEEIQKYVNLYKN